MWPELSTSIKGERPQTFPVFSPRGGAGRAEGVVGLESVTDGDGLHCAGVAVCLSDGHVLGTDVFLWHTVELTHLMKTRCV